MILETMPEVQRLTSEKKLRLIEELWDDLGVSVDEDAYPVTEEQLVAATSALADRSTTSSWADLRARLAARQK
jgi:hypothetical protein